MEFTVRSAEDLGRTIRRVRKEHSTTQEDLAARVGIDRSYLAKIERGRSSRLLDLIFDLLRALNIDVTLTFERRRDG